jgi:hypothetical protein
VASRRQGLNLRQRDTMTTPPAPIAITTLAATSATNDEQLVTSWVASLNADHTTLFPRMLLVLSACGHRTAWAGASVFCLISDQSSRHWRSAKLKPVLEIFPLCRLE